jgi:hypothetical protein
MWARRFELSPGAIMSTCLRMNRSCLQFFFAALFSFLAFTSFADFEQGRASPLNFTDVEGRQFSLRDGRATLLTVTTRETEPKAHRIGDIVPDQYVGHPHYRFVTVINFQNQVRPFLRRIIAAIVRYRFRAEADAMQPRYYIQKIAHTPRADLFAVADFDGGAVRQLGMQPTSNEFAVFVFDGRGRLIRRWNDVPARDELAKALASAL